MIKIVIPSNSIRWINFYHFPQQILEILTMDRIIEFNIEIIVSKMGFINIIALIKI